MSDEAPVPYQELNLSNYDHGDVDQLNEWGVWAYGELEKLQAENQRLRHGLSKVNEEVCQTLGKALRYPWFKDDQTNFPDSTEKQGVCVGDHVAESIAVEAARTLKGVQAENQRLRKALQSIVKHQELVSGNMSNMSATRVIALKALERQGNE